MNRKKHIYLFLGCLCIWVCLFFIRHTETCPTIVVGFIHEVFSFFIGVIEAFSLTEFFMMIKQTPPAIVVSALGFISIIIGYILLQLFSRTVNYSHKILQRDLIGVIQRGFIVYMAELLIILIFVYSVIGIPLALLMLLVTLCVNLYGMVPLSISIGEMIQENFRGNDRRTYINYTIGAISLLICVNVYAVGIAFLLFFIPVFATGVTVYTLETKAFKQFLKEDEFEHKNHLFDKRKIRDIITKGLD